MKIPTIFIPEKNLENKTKDLTKGCKLIPHEEPINLSVQDIVHIGEKVAEKFGKFGMESYKFKDKETRLIIKYTPPCWPDTCGSLKLYLKKLFFLGSLHQAYPKSLKVSLKNGLFKEKVFEFSKDYKDPLRFYSPGEWEKDLEKLYKKT